MVSQTIPENKIGEALNCGSSLTGFGRDHDQVWNRDRSKELVVITAKYTLTYLYSDGVAHDPREQDG
jgi:hypothetical protein